MTNMITLPILTDNTREVMSTDAANARAEARIGALLAPYWDGVVANLPETGAPKRAAVVRAVLTDAGLWRDTPQTDADGKRTPFGNVVQRFAARYDAAVKRANTDEPPAPDYMALAVQAASNALEKVEGATPETILAAIQAGLSAGE